MGCGHHELDAVQLVNVGCARVEVDGDDIRLRAELTHRLHHAFAGYVIRQTGERLQTRDILDAVFDQFMAEMEKLGNKIATREEADKLTETCLIKLDNGGYAANKKFVGKNANVIMEACGLKCEGDPRIVFFEAENDDPLVQTEQMMPILPIVRCKDFEEAKQRAYFAEHGNRHSASIWSCNSYRVTEFGKIIGTTIFVQNGGTMAAFGVGGSGTNGPTIATPTGEGVVDGSVFTRISDIANRMLGASFDEIDADLYPGFAFVQYVCVAAGVPVSGPETLIHLTDRKVEAGENLPEGNIVVFQSATGDSVSIMLTISGGGDKIIYATAAGGWVVLSHMDQMAGSNIYRWGEKVDISE